MQNNINAREFLHISKIIPVITIYDLDSSINLARALIAGGIRILEITLRTKEAIEAISLISKEVPEAIVGAGTILNINQLEQVKAAGAKFAISPGLTQNLAKESSNIDLPLIPGIASASELMMALEHGFKTLKFFPAEAAGGIAMLKSFGPVFGDVAFCPTGGISLKNIKDYLSLSNVHCVGGSWLTPKELILDKKWDEITKITKDSLSFIA